MSGAAADNETTGFDYSRYAAMRAVLRATPKKGGGPYDKGTGKGMGKDVGKGLNKGTVDVEDTEPLSPQPTTPQPTTPQPTTPQPTTQPQQVSINRLLIQKMKQQQQRIDVLEEQVAEQGRQQRWILATLDRVLPLETSSEH